MATKAKPASKAKKTTKMSADAKTLVSSCGTTLKTKRLKGGYKLVKRVNKL